MVKVAIEVIRRLNDESIVAFWERRKFWIDFDWTERNCCVDIFRHVIEDRTTTLGLLLVSLNFSQRSILSTFMSCRQVLRYM